MGIFSRRSRAAVIDPPSAGWQAESGDIMVCPAYLMEDEAAGDHAFGAQFYLASAPGSSLTIWTFPAECGPAVPGCWFVGYKTEYEWAGQESGVPASLYHGDLYQCEWWPSLDRAVEEARREAAALIVHGPAVIELSATPGTVAEWFAWDGAPW